MKYLRKGKVENWLIYLSDLSHVDPVLNIFHFIEYRGERPFYFYTATISTLTLTNLTLTVVF